MKKLLVLAGILVLSGCGGSDYPTWQCGEQIKITAGESEFNADEVPLPITYTATVTIGGIEAPALFRMEGVNSEWVFGDEVMSQLIGPGLLQRYLQKHNQQSINGHHKIVLMTDGTARLYDFTDVEEGESVRPTQTFQCERQ